MAGESEKTYWACGRLLTLTDGIFAIAMTIMALDLDIPIGLTHGELWLAVQAVGPKVGLYFLSFFILGRMWLAHHATFHQIENIDRTFAALTLCTLAFVALVPAATNFVNDYATDGHAVMIYTTVILATTLLDFASWRYAIQDRHILKENLAPERIRAIDIRNLVFVGMSLLVILLAYLVPEVALYSLGALLIVSPILVKLIARA